MLEIWIARQLDQMIAIADQQAFYLLEFVDCRGLERKVEQIKQTTNAVIIPGHTVIISLIERVFRLR